jgi:hypothetical protein
MWSSLDVDGWVGGVCDPLYLNVQALLLMR